ncbi:MAG: hypothetical protein CME57_06505 [Halieaceae bacterium]|nr:hypothetical protein [Halieaceae bacterium]
MLYVQKSGFIYLKLTFPIADWRSQLSWHPFWQWSRACWDGARRPHLGPSIGPWLMRVFVAKVSAVKQLERAPAVNPGAMSESNRITRRFLDPITDQL